jgi:hypothetical protein
LPLTEAVLGYKARALRNSSARCEAARRFVADQADMDNPGSDERPGPRRRVRESNEKGRLMAAFLRNFCLGFRQANRKILFIFRISG